MNKKPLVVACIPAFNEEKTIAKVVLQTQHYVDKVFVCDDGSTDMTAEIAERLGATVVKHEENKGKGRAMKTLFEEVTSLEPEVTVVLDADGQHNPSDIPRLVEPIIKGESDITVGNRYAGNLRAAAPLYRQAGLAVINWVNKAIKDSKVKDTQSGFRAYSFRALQAVADCESDGYSVESEQLILATRKNLKVREVPVTTKYRGLDSTSKKTPLTQGLGIIGFLLKMIVEERPLLFLGVPGVVSLLVGTVFGVWMLEIYATDHYITTNIALASIAFILIGFFCLSTAITLYALSRINQNLKREK
jgi:glycosyltransferase involved in cell wall biosynthesis